MSEENVEAGRPSTGETSGAVSSRYDQNIVFEPRVAGTYVGHDVVAAFLRDLVPIFVDFRTEEPDVRHLGDRVLALGRSAGAASGAVSKPNSLWRSSPQGGGL